LEEEVPTDQRAYVKEIVQRLLLCRDPSAGYARYVCPNCQYEHCVPFSCKTRFCPSCGKVRVDEWVNHIAQDLLEVPHLHLTLTIDDTLRPFFLADRRLLKDLLQVGARPCRKSWPISTLACASGWSTQLLLFPLEPLSKIVQTLTWRARIQASFGYDPLKCLRCGYTLTLVEIWEPQRGHIWMKRWLETHRQRKAARLAIEQLRAALPHYRQLAFNFHTG
jgi:hypothetical protein